MIEFTLSNKLLKPGYNRPVQDFLGEQNRKHKTSYS